MSAHARAPLSTVDMNLHEVGRTAAQRLLNAMNGGRAHGVEYLPCQLLARESTGLNTAPNRSPVTGRQSPNGTLGSWGHRCFVPRTATWPT
ncbi:MAG: substrate-binding domain-containing protein [Acidimicrobiales bacterium]